MRFKGSDRRRIVEGIARAERGNRAEIAVHVEDRYPGDGPLARARELFDRLDMDRTRDGTGVLLYVAVEDHRAAVWAGPGLVGAAAPDFWQEAARRVAEGFKVGDGVGGIVAALDHIGELARRVAAGDDEAGNELPDRVTFGGAR
ncbi:MAG: TPM domain-containing protein [Deltaproteobacteria bacterium]|nr:TPM domain-containing protein [Deltaproteobacteria bacterium]